MLRQPGTHKGELRTSKRRLTMPIANMQELTVHELCEVYDAELRFVEG